MKVKHLFSWLKASNRPKHITCGLYVFSVIFILALLLACSTTQGAILALASVCIAAFTVEYIQRLCGNVFDWLDFLATVLIPSLLTLLIIAL